MTFKKLFKLPNIMAFFLFLFLILDFLHRKNLLSCDDNLFLCYTKITSLGVITSLGIVLTIAHWRIYGLKFRYLLSLIFILLIANELTFKYLTINYLHDYIFTEPNVADKVKNHPIYQLHQAEQTYWLTGEILEVNGSRFVPTIEDQKMRIEFYEQKNQLDTIKFYAAVYILICLLSIFVALYVPKSRFIPIINNHFT